MRIGILGFRRLPIFCVLRGLASPTDGDDLGLMGFNLFRFRVVFVRPCVRRFEEHSGPNVCGSAACPAPGAIFTYGALSVYGFTSALPASTSD